MAAARAFTGQGTLAVTEIESQAASRNAVPDRCVFYIDRRLTLGETEAKWDGSNYRWTFPSGATLSFGYLNHDKDKYRYQSAAFQFIAFDELTQFPFEHYSYLFSRLRKLAGVTIPLRMRGGTNPGGLGNDWVFECFIIDDEKKKPYAFIILDELKVDLDEAMGTIDFPPLKEWLNNEYFPNKKYKEYRKNADYEMNILLNDRKSESYSNVASSPITCN